MGLSPRRTVARVGRALGRPLGPAFALLVAITACRGVIGYRPLTLGDASDAGPSAEGGPASDARADVRADSTADAAPPGDAACPGATPATLFTTPYQLQGLFLGGDRVYAEITNPFLVESDGAVLPDPSMGLVACPKSGCSVTPEVLADYTSIVTAPRGGAPPPPTADSSTRSPARVTTSRRRTGRLAWSSRRRSTGVGSSSSPPASRSRCTSRQPERWRTGSTTRSTSSLPTPR